MKLLARTNWVYVTAVNLVRIFARLYLRIKYTGLDNIPATGGCVVAANHVSYLDPPLVAIAVTRRRVIRFMARDTLYRKPVARWFFEKTLCVPVDRERGDISAIRRSLEVLKKGQVLGLFPEGTRSENGELQAAKGGVGFILAKAQVPVVPVYVQGTARAYPKGARFVRSVAVTINFGKPIEPQEFQQLGGDKQVYSKIGKLVMSRIAELKNQAGDGVSSSTSNPGAFS